MTLSPTFSFGAPEETPKPRYNGPDPSKLIPLAVKEDICRRLLAEFGVTNIRTRGAKHELIHACLIDPTHRNQDREPTASLNYENFGYRCLGCKAAGYLPWVIAHCRGYETSEQGLNWLLTEAGLDGHVMDPEALSRYFDAVFTRVRENKEITVYSERFLEPWDFTHPYLTDPISEGGRGIPEANVERMRLGWAQHYVVGERADKTKVTSQRITIPHWWKGQLVGWQTRRLTTDGTPKYLSSVDFPKDTTIYNYDEKSDWALVVEAPLTAATHCHELPIEATFSATLTETQVSLLGKHPRVVLWFDNDKAGWEAVFGVDKVVRGKVTHRPGVAEKLSKTSVVLVVESPFKQDAQEMTTEDVKGLVAAAVPYTVWRKPARLICYHCKSAAHEGPCERNT